MTPGAMLFMALSWTLVLGLTFWSFRRVLGARDRREREEPATGPFEAEEQAPE